MEKQFKKSERASLRPSSSVCKLEQDGDLRSVQSVADTWSKFGDYYSDNLQDSPEGLPQFQVSTRCNIYETYVLDRLHLLLQWLGAVASNCGRRESSVN